MIIGVVTPALNAAGQIGATVSSIVNQDAVISGKVQIRYIVQDGGSSDDTVDIAQKVGGDLVRVVSAQDRGMYDALANAWNSLDELGGADWYCYLNAGDKWEPSCLDVIHNFAEHAQSRWLCGVHAYYAASGPIVHTSLPFRYRQNLLRVGAYGRGLPTLQQESTFWHSSLHTMIDRDKLRKFMVAGDAYLWWTFAEAHEPSIVQAVLGGFRYHGSHLGVSRKQYRAEMADFAGELDAVARGRIAADRLMWEQPARVKARFNPNLYLYSTSTGGWHSSAKEVPPLPTT